MYKFRSLLNTVNIGQFVSEVEMWRAQTPARARTQTHMMI
jgi:hypothetical protein